MTILSGDIKLLASDTMTDAPEGGGAMTGTEIVTNVSNNVFEDISYMDRTTGAVHLRKVFGAVRAQNTDHFLGSHAIISKLPGDAKLGINLFNTNDWFDRRDAAKSRVEAYLSKGPKIKAFLFGTQYQGSRLVTIFANSSNYIKENDVFVIEDTLTEDVQFVRAETVSVTSTAFTDTQGVFYRAVYTLELSTPLERDFPGYDISRLDNLTGQSTLYFTVVSNASRFYSSRPTSQEGLPGDSSVYADSVYTQILPASQMETISVDVEAIASTSIAMAPSALTNIEYTDSNSYSSNSVIFLGSGVLPGTLSINASGTILTDSAGEVVVGSTVVGSINYSEGKITFSSSAPTYSGTKTISFMPGVNTKKSYRTSDILVTEGNRGYSWSITVSDYLPVKGGTEILYRSLGHWGTLMDDSAGGLYNDIPGLGSGSVNYDTGVINVTLGSLPDVGSRIIIRTSDNLGINILASAVARVLETQAFTLQETPTLNTLTLAWNDGTARTATSDASGVITGDATGNCLQKTLGPLTMTNLPTPGSNLTVDYDYIVPGTTTVLDGSGSHDVSYDGSTPFVLDLGATDIDPSSFSFSYTLEYEDWYSSTIVGDDRITIKVPIHLSWTKQFTVTVVPGTAGQLQAEDYLGHQNLLTYPANNLDVATGIFTINLSHPGYAKVERIVYNLVTAKYTSYEYVNLPVNYIYDPDSRNYTYKAKKYTAPVTQSLQEVFSINALTYLLGANVGPESSILTIGTKTYRDNNGTLVYDLSTLTGSGSVGGSLDRTSGNFSFSYWPSGIVNQMFLNACSEVNSFTPVKDVSFITSESPVKDSATSFNISYTLLESGTVEVASAAAGSGSLSATHVTGNIDFETGLVKLTFTEDILADSLLYTAVTLRFIPMSSVTLGLDPVRLPIDGRIPLYQVGDVVIVLHDQTLSGTYTSSTTLDLGRTRIYKLVVLDLGGNLLAEDKYSVDLDTGIITWGDLTGVSQPITTIDRVEDSAVVLDVEITGKITLSTPLTHTFPVGETLVANALLYGTIYARTSIPFDQQTWTNVWSDLLIGSESTAQYNNSQYPIIVDNLSCIQERWLVLFTSSTTASIIGEHVGQVLTNVDVSANIAPINPTTSLPYFTIPSAGIGSGWSTGNCIRFNTYAANAPCWVIESIGQGPATDTDYSWAIEFRGDVDAP